MTNIENNANNMVLIIGGCGYIGSALSSFLNASGFVVRSIDLEWFGNFLPTKNVAMDFRNLGRSFLNEHSAVILLAGHSSVQMCVDVRRSVFQNNVSNFIELLDKISPDQKLIYASSSSLYAGCFGSADENYSAYIPTNYYDLSKKEIDLYAALSNAEYYGLRFGTVNGPSLNFRTDLMINKMYLNAKATGKISIYNKEVRRPILGIRDLCRGILAILTANRTPGIYNMASFNCSVGEIAERVGALTGAAIEDKGSSPTYDFHIDTTRFQKTFDFEFMDTVESIVSSIDDKIDQCHQTSRSIAKKYAIV